MSNDRIFRDQTSGSFILFGYPDAREVLGDNTLWKDPDRAEPAAVLLKSFKPANSRSEDYNSSMLWLDGAEHDRVRAPFARAFLRRASAAREIVEEIVAARLAALGDRKSFDAIKDYAAQIPVEVILRFIGAESTDLPLIRPWAAALNKIFQPQRSDEDNREMAAAMESFATYFDALIAERRRSPCDDLTSDIVVPSDSQLSASEIRVNLIGLVVGGVLSTADLIGNAIWLLIGNGAERQKLLDDPSLINAAIEEVLRLEAPVGGAQRVASRDLSFGNCPVAKTQVVVASIPTANRDPAAFENPTRFDIGRKPQPHLSFGGGKHICLGAPLARLEAQVAVCRLFQRYPDLRLANPGAPLKWRPTPFFHGLEELALHIA
jgi:cytochrome P450